MKYEETYVDSDDAKEIMQTPGWVHMCDETKSCAACHWNEHTGETILFSEGETAIYNKLTQQPLQAIRPLAEG